MAPDVDPRTRVVLFDGVCNLCNGSVQFILDRDPSGVFRFASLQSNVAAELLRERGVELHDTLGSVLLVEGRSVFSGSDAVLRIVRELRAPWPALTVLRAIPRGLRDLVYRFVAHHRYRWFGRSATCRVPTPETRGRFLADEAPPPVAGGSQA